MHISLKYEYSFESQVFFAVTLGSMLLGQTAATCFQALNSARGAASIVFKTIDEVCLSCLEYV